MNEVTIIGKLGEISIGDRIENKYFIVKEGNTNHYIYSPKGPLEQLKLIPENASIKVKAHINNKGTIMANKVFVLIGENNEHEEI